MLASLTLLVAQAPKPLAWVTRPFELALLTPPRHHELRWMRGHDHPAADGTPFPDSATLKKRIDDLEAWMNALRLRRK